MGKIKDMLTGLFSKKDEDDADEIIQIQSVDEPDRDFMENENRYETPDYQAFLSELGHVEKGGEERSADMPEWPQDDSAAAHATEPFADEAAQAAEHLVQADDGDAATAFADENMVQALDEDAATAFTAELENLTTAQAEEKKTTDLEEKLAGLEAVQASDPDTSADFEAKLAEEDVIQAPEPDDSADFEAKLAEKDVIQTPEPDDSADFEAKLAEEDEVQVPEIEFDSAFIDEGVAELGVNDVWTEEES